MNYIKEINAFHEEQFTNPVSGKAMNLWFTLMYINNKTNWQKSFTVAASVLCLHGKLSNSSFKRARTELKEKGYIRYQSRAGNQSAVYEIISLHHMDDHYKNDDQKTVTDPEVLNHSKQVQSKMNDSSIRIDQVLPNSSPFLDRNVSPLVKQNETKQRSSSAADDAIAFFKENFGKMSSYIHDDIQRWTSNTNQSLVITAMKRALDRGKTSWGYVKGILHSWKNQGVLTIEDTKRELENFQNPAHSPFRKQTDEIIPDWFQQRNINKQKTKIETAKEKEDRLEVDRLLAAYS